MAISFILLFCPISRFDWLDFQVIPRRRFYSYWDHHLNASKATLRSILSEVRPAALVFTAGPWFSWHQDADFGWFATNMNRTLNNLVELKKEVLNDDDIIIVSGL